MNRWWWIAVLLLVSACPRRHRPPLPPGSPRPPRWSLEVVLPEAE